MSLATATRATSSGRWARAGVDVANRHGAVLSRGSLALTLPSSGGRMIPSGFLGLSFEYPAVEAYAGQDPTAINPVLERLIANLTPGQAPILRIGGDTTDWTWWPVAHMRRPPGVTGAITPGWLQVAHALAVAVGAHLILGINLEANDARLAAAEAYGLLGGIGVGSIEAFELGNEPELYHAFGWYRTPTGQEVPGRPPRYGFGMFSREFAKMARDLPGPLAGPTTGAQRWLSHWPAFLAEDPRVRLATLHRYGLHACTQSAASPGYPTVAHLLSDTASVAPAATAAPFVNIAHAAHVRLRIDEMNTTPCQGAFSTVGHSFASAL